MATIAENLQQLINNKAAIKAALEYAGLSPTDDMSTYAQLIKDIANLYYGGSANGSVSLYTGELYIAGKDRNNNPLPLRSYAFARVKSSKIEIAEGLTLIPAYCFYYSSCPLVIVPSTITQINSNAFSTMFGQDNQVTIICKATTPPILQNATFTVATGRTLKIYVPDASVNDYKAAQYWSNVENDIYPISEYTPT